MRLPVAAEVCRCATAKVQCAPLKMMCSAAQEGVIQVDLGLSGFKGAFKSHFGCHWPVLVMLAK